MSAIPESKLAREAEIAYVMICMSTDYDSWKSEAEGVDVTQVMSTMKTNSLNACLIVKDIVKAVDASIKNGMESLKKLEGSMKNACCTTKEHRNKDTVEKLNFILPGYF